MANRTSAQIAFELVDVEAKPDSTPAATDKQSFIDLSDLKLDELTPPKVATFERDLWTMDGSFSLFPDDPESYEWGLWSASMSDVTGAFAVPPVLTVTLAGNHTSLGVTLTFYEPTGDYCNDLNVKWYDASNALLADQDYTPDAVVYFCEKQVLDFRKIVITFRNTYRPYRYLKLSAIAYGQIKIFGTDELISASVLEEIDPLSAELTINTLNFRVHSTDAKFNIMNPDGIYASLQQKQPLTVRETVNGAAKLMGVYYLDEWDNDTENTVRMKGVDLLGIMDKTTFRGGIYSSVTLGTIVGAIITSAGVEYELDAFLASITLSGWIPICSHREALQQAAFAAGAIVDCARSNKVKIYPPRTAVSHNVPRSRKLRGQQVKLKPVVTGVEVTSHTYTAGTEAVQLFQGTLPIGSHEISFSEPAHTLSVSGATIASSGANYAVLTVASAGTVTLLGKRYIDGTQVYGVYMPSLPAGAKPNVLKVQEATLVSAAIGQTVAQRIYDYYQQRHSNEVPIILADEAPGDVVDVESMYDQHIIGTVEKLDISLTGGFIGKAVITGGVGSS
ncbi:MAG: hypothetical protein AB9835_14570 [Eubacteriales bacterium]